MRLENVVADNPRNISFNLLSIRSLGIEKTHPHMQLAQPW